MKYMAAILAFLLLASSTGSCLSGGGLRWTLDGQEHSFTWRSGR